jgi:sulfite reductase (NADPH) flavoprotein alpha-component
MRYLIAAAIVVLYIAFTFAILRAHRRKAASARVFANTAGGANVAGFEASTTPASSFGRASLGAADFGVQITTHGELPPPLLVAYASQTGFAEQLANHAAHSLNAANIPSRVRSLADLSADELSATERALFVVSTYGEGDPPDTGLPFVHSVMSRSPALSRLGYGVLALGDRTYQNFCGFGRTLDGWLRRQCAVPMFDLIEVDNADEAALLHWQRHLGALTGRDNLPAWTPPRNERWRISNRVLINPGSAGHPCYHIELEPLEGGKLEWRAGDIAVLTPPGTNAREYSIASIPEEGSIHILVRQSRRADGTLGIASGWLTEQAPLGSSIPLRIRPNTNFHAPADHQPMILIGNGTGLAGLRSLVKSREGKRDTRNWLLFGERNAAHDAFYKTDIDRWLSNGTLTRADFAFSRDQDTRLYVQHLVDRHADEIRNWMADGAVIYVCGSAAGMATAVDESLAAALSRETLDLLITERRYRRDVY